jgi:hypothetical protein
LKDLSQMFMEGNYLMFVGTRVGARLTWVRKVLFVGALHSKTLFRTHVTLGL